MNTRLILTLLLLGFTTGGASAAFEDGLPPTIDEAHAFLGGTFQRYSIAFANGNVRRAAPGRAVYDGVGCVSELTANQSKRTRTLDWSAISSVAQSGDHAVEFIAVNPGGNFRLYFPNERATRSAANAFEVLRSACMPPALTARR